MATLETAPRIAATLEERVKAIGRSYLWVMDFDGTAGDTFSDSPAGGNVEQNYRQTLEEIFGGQVLSTYLSAGGLNNRAPAEVISDLYDKHPEVIELARNHLDRHRAELESVMKPTIGNLDVWEIDPLKAATEVYIRQDLISSLGHIGLKHEDGSVWPRMCNGFGELWDTIHELNGVGGFHIDTAVLSSGYTEYIKSCFEAWGKPQPDIWVTDDQTRARRYPENMLDRVKPAPFGLALAHQLWLKRYGLSGYEFWGDDTNHTGSVKWLDAAAGAKERISYWGDGLDKDGGLARRARVHFGHFNPKHTGVVHGEHKTTFGDWRDISYILRSSTSALAAGVAMRSIIREEAT